MVVGITTIIIGCTKRCAIGMFSLADVIAIKADVCLVFGRCYCHVAGVVATIYIVFLLADVIAMWLVLLPLLCSDVVG